MKKWINWNVVVYLFILQWLLTPIGVDTSQFKLERLFLGIFFLTFLVIEWKKIQLSKKMFWLFTSVFAGVGILLGMNLYTEGHDGYGSALIGFILPWFVDYYKKLFKKTEE
jgi:hypothetical protein